MNLADLNALTVSALRTLATRRHVHYTTRTRKATLVAGVYASLYRGTAPYSRVAHYTAQTGGKLTTRQARQINRVARREHFRTGNTVATYRPLITV